MRVRRKLRKIKAKLFAKIRKLMLKNSDFSIISDNCWGSFSYQYFGLPYRTPFVGLFLFSPDYIALLRDLEGHLSEDIKFISPSQSKYSQFLSLDNWEAEGYPIGLLKGSEIHFLHYSSEEEARDKWTRRIQRINYDNLIVKFCDRDLSSEELIKEFDSMPYSNKVLLTAKQYPLDSCIKLKGESGEFIEDEWDNYLKTVKPLKYFNGMLEKN